MLFSFLFCCIIVQRALSKVTPMKYHEKVPKVDQGRIDQALRDIKRHGDRFQYQTAKFIEETEIVIFLDLAERVGGSGSVQLDNASAARRAVWNGDLGVFEAARYVRLNIARETIDTGGQRGIEGTFVHEGKHARDFALMLSTYSREDNDKVFNPSAFQRELSAHITSALYLMRRGGEYTDEGISLGLLHSLNGKVRLNSKGIRARLRNNYGLTPEDQGGYLNECSDPKIGSPRKKFLGIF